MTDPTRVAEPNRYADPYTRISALEQRLQELEEALRNAPRPSTEREDLIYELWWQKRCQVLSTPEAEPPEEKQS